MSLPRVIATLLLSGEGLYKTIKFRNPRYVGDPVNVVRIFNDKGADELAILDIDAARERTEPNYPVLADLASQAFMPLAYGGGIRSAATAERIISSGFEKVIVGTAAVEEPTLVSELAQSLGSQSVVVSVDVRRPMFRSRRISTRGGTKDTHIDPVQFARDMEERGAGELLVVAIDRDGTLEGYDHELVQSIASNVTIPVIASGGASSVDDLRNVMTESGAAAAAAGALFVYSGPHRAVLINYPQLTD